MGWGWGGWWLEKGGGSAVEGEGEGEGEWGNWDGRGAEKGWWAELERGVE